MSVCLDTSPAEISRIRGLVDVAQKNIAKQLASEGVVIEEGWTYDVCCLILMRLPKELFDYAFHLVSISDTVDIGVMYHMAYKKAAEDCSFHRHIEDICT